MNEISAFIKEIPARRPIYKIGSGLSSDTGSYQNIDSGLFSLRTVRNAFVVCKSLNLWYFCYRSSNGLTQRLFCSSCLFLIALPMHFCFHGTNSIPNRRTKKKIIICSLTFYLNKKYRLLSPVSNSSTILSDSSDFYSLSLMSISCIHLAPTSELNNSSKTN